MTAALVVIALCLCPFLLVLGILNICQNEIENYEEK